MKSKSNFDGRKNIDKKVRKQKKKNSAQNEYEFRMNSWKEPTHSSYAWVIFRHWTIIVRKYASQQFQFKIYNVIEISIRFILHENRILDHQPTVLPFTTWMPNCVFYWQWLVASMPVQKSMFKGAYAFMNKWKASSVCSSYFTYESNELNIQSGQVNRQKFQIENNIDQKKKAKR